MVLALQQRPCCCTTTARADLRQGAHTRLLTRAALARPEGQKSDTGLSKQGRVALAGLAAALTLASTPHLCSARAVLPPIDQDPKRCERAYVGNTIGQANAVADKLLDLRKCNFKDADLSKKVLSGALISESDVSGANLREAVLTKAYAAKSDFTGADLTNAVVDRVDFRKANLKNVKFKNTVVTGSVFEDANLEGAVFEDALIGREDVKKLCLNPSLQGEARQDVGCRTK
ncbi:hypothetical protein WJX73_007128 [Symbiochloris irregularis]|uniref:Thylakoid lumenal 17.4 kDa protein, chloroplastic n=1 Tax=Symbiochloris irregularis TaxID=706552 RepID=A0AAW1PUA0_9CHLO